MEDRMIHKLILLKEATERLHTLIDSDDGNLTTAQLQSLRIQINQNRIRIKHLVKQIKDIINTRIFNISYKLNGEPHKALLAGMTQADVSVLLTNLAIAEGYNIEILEIKEIPTFLCDGKL